MSTDACVPPEIAEIAAPLLLGALWNWALYGIEVVQVYVYSYNFPQDKRSIELLGIRFPHVSSLALCLSLLQYTVFLLETLQTCLSGADLYYWFVSGFSDMGHLANPYASAYDIAITGAVISVIVQFFFSYRIWILSGRKAARWLCATICLLSI
ncbi:hypothetical protein BC834DRAFT_693386 [Gloeopeniophorella convolvens]|nr:hypothetical protein BC834DRAFT_693386 [Gloeopeniophorella convolvens]